MNKFNSMMAVALLALTFTACKKDKDEPIIEVPPSDGSTLTLQGVAGSEAGSSAANSVYVDFSADKQTSVLRDSWDLGFYSGSDFKVIINATNGSSVMQLDKTNLNDVTEADLIKQTDLTLALGSVPKEDVNGDNAVDYNDNPEFKKVDNPIEARIINKTAISEISATDANNKVYLLNPSGGSHTAVFSIDNVYKIRILRKGTGYTLQYAKLKSTTFNSLDIAKDDNFNFKHVSLTQGKTVDVEPVKTEWDIVWTWSLYYSGGLPNPYIYGFSDLVFVNNLGGTQASEVTAKSYADFSESDVAGVTFSTSRDAIADKWRVTTGTGIKPDRFYLIKDASGNVYKLKFVSMGVGSDGGTRGKPVIEYKLVKKG